MSRVSRYNPLGSHYNPLVPVITLLCPIITPLAPPPALPCPPNPLSPSPRAAGLQPERSYQFLVSARSRLGWGRVARALVYTTSNRERPQAPSAPQVSQSQVLSDRITFSWTPGRDGFAPLRWVGVLWGEGGGGKGRGEGRLGMKGRVFSVWERLEEERALC